jgi:hypothetical protein
MHYIVGNRRRMLLGLELDLRIAHGSMINSTQGASWVSTVDSCHADTSNVLCM